MASLPSLTSALDTAAALASALPRPPHWHFRDIEVEVRISRKGGPVTFARAAFCAKNARGRWTQGRTIGVYEETVDPGVAVGLLIEKLRSPDLDVPWRRRDAR